MNKILGIFKVNPMIIISDLKTAQLLRYNNCTNDMDLFTVATKYSFRGPSALGETSKRAIAIHYRGIHNSYLGRLSLNTCSAGDPGLSGVFCPFLKLNGLYFK
jgi:hypothetical protein